LFIAKSNDDDEGGIVAPSRGCGATTVVAVKVNAQDNIEASSSIAIVAAAVFEQ
jgi:hypothetical protein